MNFLAADADVRAMGSATTAGAGTPELSLEEALAFFDGCDDPALLQMPSMQQHTQQTSHSVHGDAGAFTHVQQQQQFQYQQHNQQLQQLQQRQLQYQQFQQLHQLQYQQQQQHGANTTDVLMMMDTDADDFISSDTFLGNSMNVVDMAGGDDDMNADFGMMANMLQPLHLDDALMLSSGDNEAVVAEMMPMQSLLAASLASTEFISTTTSVTSVQATVQAKSTDTKVRQRATKAKAAAKSSSPQTSQKQSQVSTKVATTTSIALVPRATASKATTSSATTSNSTSTKRVRRQKEELLYLRTKVVELEERLQQLKRVNGETSSTRGSPAPSSSDDADGVSTGGGKATDSPSSSPTTATSTPNSNSNYTVHPSPANSRKKRRGEDESEDTDDAEDEGSPCAISPALLASVWENVAERQYKERLRAEQQNKKLKTMLEGQIKLATSLEKILKKRPNMEVLYPDTDNGTASTSGNTKPPKSQRVITYEESDEDIFKKQLAGVEKAYLRMDDVMAAADFFTSEETRHDFRVKEYRDEEDGVLMEFMATNSVPFDLQITGNALWRFMSDVGVRKHCYYEEVLHSSEDTSSRKFGVRLAEGGQDVDLRGRHTLRRYIEEDRIVLVWKSLMEPIQLAGTKLRGLRFNDVGWMVAQKSETSSSTSGGGGAKTLIKVYGQLCPCPPDESDENDCGQDEQIGALTDFVINCHESNAALCLQLVNDLLVEEEWKTTLPVTL